MVGICYFKICLDSAIHSMKAQTYSPRFRLLFAGNFQQRNSISRDKCYHFLTFFCSSIFLPPLHAVWLAKELGAQEWLAIDILHSPFSIPHFFPL